MEVLTLSSEPPVSCGKFHPFSRFRGLARKAFSIFHLAFWLVFLGWNPADGQVVSHEYPLKAVFLLNFAQFTGWPASTLEHADSPLVIGVLGTDPFGAVLDDAVRGETVNGRKFVVQRYRHVADATNCQILFISQSETPHWDAIMAALKGKPVLTVSEIDGTSYRGVCVRFITENNKIRLRINTATLKNAGLTMSSQLLRLAEIVTTQPHERPSRKFFHQAQDHAGHHARASIIVLVVTIAAFMLLMT